MQIKVYENILPPSLPLSLSLFKSPRSHLGYICLHSSSIDHFVITGVFGNPCNCHTPCTFYLPVYVK